MSEVRAELRPRLSIVIGALLLFSISFAYLVEGTVDRSRSEWAVPQWQGAHWIAPAESSAIGYFRRWVELPSAAVRAHLIVAGTDKFAVFVNGNAVNSRQFFGSRASLVADVTGSLRKGRNVIAVQVISQRRAHEPELAARLEMWLADGTHRTVKSDATWRALGMEIYQRARRSEWHELEFDDLSWPPAVVLEPGDAHRVRDLRVPSSVYRSLPAGQWIWRSSNAEGGAVFVRTFDVDGRATEAWLGVSRTGRYAVTLNGLSLTSVVGTRNSMELFDINSYVRPGPNELLIHLAGGEAPRRLAVSGFVETATGRVDLHSDGRWRSRETGAAPGRNAGTTPVVVMADVMDPAVRPAPKLVFEPLRELDESRAAVRVLETSASAFLFAVIALVALFQVARVFTGATQWQSLETLALPIGWGAIAIGALILVRKDAQADVDVLFGPAALVAPLVAIAVWEALVLVELRRRRPS
jgi:hypothetical protein